MFITIARHSRTWYGYPWNRRFQEWRCPYGSPD